MNRTVFALPARSDYVTRAGLAITRVAEQFTGGASRLDDLVSLLDRRRPPRAGPGPVVERTVRAAVRVRDGRLVRLRGDSSRRRGSDEPSAAAEGGRGRRGR